MGNHARGGVPDEARKLFGDEKHHDASSGTGQAPVSSARTATTTVAMDDHFDEAWR
jgi:hypothetical protein